MTKGKAMQNLKILLDQLQHCVDRAGGRTTITQHDCNVIAEALRILKEKGGE